MTSSPYYAQANGLAEKTVNTVKSVLLKSSDPYLGLLSYRSTPLELSYSPAQLLMSSNFRTTVAVITGQLKTSVIDCQRFRDKDENNKKKQKRNFDSHHSIQEQPILNVGSQVWIPDLQTKGTVQEGCIDKKLHWQYRKRCRCEKKSSTFKPPTREKQVKWRTNHTRTTTWASQNHQVMLRNLAVPRKLQGVEEKSKPQTDMYDNVNIVVWTVTWSHMLFIFRHLVTNTIWTDT